MSLFNTTKKNEKPGNKAIKNNSLQGSKFIAKGGTKAASPSKKPIKTGGSRGS